MYTVLCFGDSNTWGYDPENGTRYPLESTWPYVMEKSLSKTCRVSVDALNGRTTGVDDPTWPDRNGLKQLPICLESHEPIDLIIIMLGTNDLKYRLKLSSQDITSNLGNLIRICQNSKFCGSKEERKILVISPPPITKEDGFPDNEFKDGIEKSSKLAAELKKIAHDLKCEFFDASGIVSLSGKDGVHFTSQDHSNFGVQMAEVVRKVLIDKNTHEFSFA